MTARANVTLGTCSVDRLFWSATVLSRDCWLHPEAYDGLFTGATALLQQRSMFIELASFAVNALLSTTYYMIVLSSFRLSFEFVLLTVTPLLVIALGWYVSYFCIIFPCVTPSPSPWYAPFVDLLVKPLRGE